MSTNVKLSDAFVDQAKRYVFIKYLAVPKQIKHCSQIGKIAEENPDLPYAVIHDILLAGQEEVIGEYTFN